MTRNKHRQEIERIDVRVQNTQGNQPPTTDTNLILQSEGAREINDQHKLHSKQNEQKGNEDSNFFGIERQVIKRLFFSGVKEDDSVDKITEYMKKINATPTFVRLIQGKRRGTTSVHINVIAKDFKVANDKDFWPMR